MCDSIFYKLPDMLKQYVLEFSFTGPYYLTYDYKSKSFIKKINPHFHLLNKANQFKIDNPPEEFIEGPYEEDEYHQQILTLTFRYPLELSEDKRDYECKAENNLIITYIYTIDLFYDETYNCSIVIPLYYHTLFETGRLYIENLLKTMENNTKQYNSMKYLMDGFNKKTYGYDINIC